MTSKWDRPQPQAASLDHGIQPLMALEFDVARELHDQDGVFRGQPHQRHKADSREDIDVLPKRLRLLPLVLLACAPYIDCK